MSDAQIVTTGVWQWLQGTGLERFEFLRSGDEWLLRGTILSLAGDEPVEARYELACDRAFLTRRARISIRDSAGERALEISAADGRWHVNGSENPAVRGALDIDLGWSPSTNTLPIRRLGLQIGQASGEFTAAWVRFPGLILEPLPQEYSRIADRVYRYSSRSGAFTAQLKVDGQGLVLDYEGFWRRVSGEAQE
jgi:uncharacterized protein